MIPPMDMVFKTLRNDRVIQFHGSPLTIDLLAEHAYELFRQREEDIKGSNRVVDVFSTDTYVDLMVRRAWGWCRDKLGPLYFGPLANPTTTKDEE